MTQEKTPYLTIIPFIVSLALFMESLDTTIINTAIPAMADSLRVNPIDLKIALISYLLSLAVFIPISGWVADKFGIKKVFIISLCVFTLSSFWCGYANNLTELIIARSLQGLGGSQMLPLGRLIIVRTFPRHEFITAMARIIMVVAMGMMLGPLLGGLITHYISWRWIFWVNVPVGIVTALMAARWLKHSRTYAVPPLDILGFLLFGTGLSGMVFSLSAFSETNIQTSTALHIMLTSILLLVVYYFYSRRKAHPIVKAKLFQSRTFRISILGNLLSRLGFGGIPFLVPLLLQVAFGYSAILSGLLLSPIALGVVIIKPLSLPLLRFLGFKKLLFINTFVVSLSIWSFSTININTPLWYIAFNTFIFGFLIALQFSGMSSLGFSSISDEDLSAATSVISTTQQLSQSFGVAVGALLVGYFSPANLHYHLTPEVFHHTFSAMAVITILTSVLFLRLKDKDGDELLRKKQPVA